MKTIEEINPKLREGQSSLTFDLRIARLEERDVASGSKVLSEAFASYPVANYMFEGLEDGPARFRVMFNYLIKARLVRNWPVFGCFEGGRVVGVAVVSEPGDEWSTPELDRIWDNACSVMGAQAIERFMEYAEACDVGLPDWRHHYLGILGVHPGYQRKGIGRALVDAVILDAHHHPDSEGVCLNTEAPMNVPFYEKAGFEVIDSRDVGSIHTWCMARAF